MPISDEELRRFDRLLGTYRNRTAAALAAIWDNLGTYDEAAIARFAEQAAPVLAAAKQSAVASSVAVFTLAADLLEPPAVAPDMVEVEARIDHPFHATWHAVGEGRPNDEALRAGRSQAEAVAMDFVQQTARRTGDAAARSAGIRPRWRRVPNAGACTWCKTIAGQTYHSAESADFGHDRCYCMVVPAGGVTGSRVTRTTERGEGRRSQRATPLNNALDRAADARRQLATERDPARRRRLEERIRRWDARAQGHARKLASDTEIAATEQMQRFNRLLTDIDEHVRNFRRS